MVMNYYVSKNVTLKHQRRAKQVCAAFKDTFGQFDTVFDYWWYFLRFIYTDRSGVAAAYSVIVGKFVYNDLNQKVYSKSCVEAVSITGATCVVATVFLR